MSDGDWKELPGAGMHNTYRDMAFLKVPQATLYVGYVGVGCWWEVEWARQLGAASVTSRETGTSDTMEQAKAMALACYVMGV